MTNGENNEEEDPEPIKVAPLKKLAKQKSDKRTGGDAIDSLIGQLEFLAERLWMRASRYADERGKKTVQEQDIQRAYDDLLYPHDLLKDAAEELDMMSDTMDEFAEQSPVFEDYRDDGD